MLLSFATVHSFTFISVANMNSDRDPSVRREYVQFTNSSTNVDLAQQLLCLRDTRTTVERRSDIYNHLLSDEETLSPILI